MEYIELSKQKPEQMQKVLCISREVSHPFVCIYYDNGWFDPACGHINAETDYEYSNAEIVSSFENSSITHWMPLPNPPKEK